MNISQEARDAAEEIWLACCHVENEKPADPVSAYHRAFQRIAQTIMDAAEARGHARGVAEERERAAGIAFAWHCMSDFAPDIAAAIREQDQ